MLLLLMIMMLVAYYTPLQITCAKDVYFCAQATFTGGEGVPSRSSEPRVDKQIKISLLLASRMCEEKGREPETLL